jgi:uncharacterized protein (DUF305 family)
VRPPAPPRPLVAVAAGVVLVAGIVALAVDGAGARGPRHGEVDVGFLQDMIDHHEQANLLAAVALRGDASPPVRNLALDVVASQRYEIGLMEGWLMEWGLDRGDPGRRAMAWMGMATAPDAMPGMATQGQITALAGLAGGDLDVEFLRLMADHHRGGVHMADAAVREAEHPNVRWLAGTMSRNQRREIRDIETLLAD